MKKEVGLFIIYLLISSLFLWIFTNPDVIEALFKTLTFPLRK
jgi:hypothetical protein